VFHFDVKRFLATPLRKQVIAVHFLLHGLHHKLPGDSLRLVFPPLLTLPVVALLHEVARPCTPLDGPFLAGVLTGYILYDMYHFAVHSPRFKHWPLFASMRKRHMSHHFQDQKSGYGITSPIWDAAFGTLCKK